MIKGIEKALILARLWKLSLTARIIINRYGSPAKASKRLTGKTSLRELNSVMQTGL